MDSGSKLLVLKDEKDKIKRGNKEKRRGKIIKFRLGSVVY